VPALRRKLFGSREKPGAHRRLTGADRIDRVIEIDQSPIGRTPRSNAATYTKVFDLVRRVFTQTREAKVRGYGPGRFSFNVKGGRCETCRGQGVRKVEMHFLPDVYVTCQECKGMRFSRETLEIAYRTKSIADVLEMRVSEALGSSRTSRGSSSNSRRSTRWAWATSRSARTRPRSRAARPSA
jgi:excinuclease ABC subunit A